MLSRWIIAKKTKEHILRKQNALIKVRILYDQDVEEEQNKDDHIGDDVHGDERILRL